MARIRRGVSLLAMGTIVLGALLIMPALPGKAMGTPLVFSSTTPLAGTLQARPFAQSGGKRETLQIQPVFPLSHQQEQASSGASPLVPAQKKTQAAQQPGAHAQPAASGGGAPIQSTTTTDDSQASEQELTQASDGEDTFVGFSGPFSVNISWGDDLDATVASGRLKNISATLMVGDITSDYQVMINWGDGTVACNTIGKDFSNKSFHLSGLHAYNSAGTYQVSFTVKASNGSQIMASRSLAIP